MISSIQKPNVRSSAKPQGRWTRGWPFRPAAVLVVLGALTAGTPGALNGQATDRWAIEVGGGMVSSTDANIDPTGALYGRLLIYLDSPEWLRIGIMASQLWSRSERDGLSCNRIDPSPQGCEPEHLDERIAIRSYRVGAFPEFDLTGRLRARAGVGISMNELNGSSHGATTGRLGNLHVVPWGHIGGFTELALLWTPFQHVPLDAVIGGGGNLVWFDACSSHADLFTPYCRATFLTEFRVGLSYRVGA